MHQKALSFGAGCKHLLTLAEPSGASQSGWDCPYRSTRPAAALEVYLLRGIQRGRFHYPTNAILARSGLRRGKRARGRQVVVRLLSSCCHTDVPREA